MSEIAVPAQPRTNFFDEQKRRRRSGRLLSVVCLLIASGIGVILSSVVTPLLLLAGGGLLLLLARLAIFPTASRTFAHALGHWASGHMAHFDAFIASLDHISRLSDLGVTVAPLLRLAPVSVPALIAAGLIWVVLRRISLRGEGGDLITRLNARPANPHDLEEHQLTNIVAEMAIAAGLPEPTLLMVDSPAINAAAVGRTQRQSTVMVTRGLLDQLDREETSGVVAHLVAAIGAGDLRLTHGILAVFQTFGFFVTFLDLPFRLSAWRALGGLALAMMGLQRSPEATTKTLALLERGMDAEAMPDVDKLWSEIPWPRVRKILLVPLLPLILISIILRVVLFLWTALFLGPPLALIWRNRRYAADAMAVQLTRDPDGLARALTRIAGSEIPAGGEGREYCFINAPAGSGKRGFTHRRTITASLHPAIDRRLARLNALGATTTGGGKRTIRFDVIRQYPFRALIVGLLLTLLLPVGGALIAAVGYLTAIAMTLGLAAGLSIAAGVLWVMAAESMLNRRLRPSALNGGCVAVNSLVDGSEWYAPTANKLTQPGRR